MKTISCYKQRAFHAKQYGDVNALGGALGSAAPQNFVAIGRYIRSSRIRSNIEQSMSDIKEHHRWWKEAVVYQVWGLHDTVYHSYLMQ